ncbi:MAG TPA: phosphoribosyltransferase [Blastocatellia bacterium]|nr:phosphoribosyltransferase [Blastocatellia bacterium]HMV87508.1 phosphoribosyltransferase [Blastocatellia bacterium]HNG34373.1 phosphoribosyltransferase [Blastocatellia bacterium]
MRFKDRAEAGRLLAQTLGGFAGRQDVIVLALPRGGVPVAHEIANALNVPLDVLPVRKLGVPELEEFAMGAIASGGARVLNEDVVQRLAITEEAIDEITRRESCELKRREQLYRGNRRAPQLTGRTVILVDDGLATGSTMQAAVEAVRRQHPARMIVAVPVAATSSCESLNRLDEGLTCVCELAVEPFYAVGLWYENFGQTTDEEVCKLLKQARLRVEAKARTANSSS